jgi:hypothetical protein
MLIVLLPMSSLLGLMGIDRSCLGPPAGAGSMGPFGMCWRGISIASEGIEMSDLIFTARGAANGLTAPMGVVTRCVSITDASLSLSLSLLARLASR